MDVSQNLKQVNTSYTDEDLFVLMSFKADNEEEAKEAFRIFYDRYKKLLWFLCNNVCSRFDGNREELAKDVFNNVMMAIYEHPTFDSKKSKLSTWISRIAKNEMLDLIDLLKEKRIGEKFFSHLNGNIVSPIYEEDYDDIEIDTPRKVILDDTIKMLSEKDQEILLTYMMYQDGNKHLPDEVLKELCDKYETTSVNLRKIKERALQKVKTFIIQNSDLLNN